MAERGDAPLHLDFGPVRPWGRPWVASRPGSMRRASCALADDGRVWLVDPVDGPGLDETIAALGDVAGVVQLLDRHARDGAALAERHGVPLHVNPVDGVPGAPFRTIPLVQRRLWREVAIWWPAHDLLAVPETIGTASYFRAPGARVGVHPMMRLTPPRALAELSPRVLLPGHGDALEDERVGDDLRRAILRSRMDIPRWLVSLPRAFGRG
jgi:hypothetical protein